MSKLKIENGNMVEIPIGERNALTFDELESLTDEESETTRTINEQESTENKMVINVMFYRKN